jgi:glutamine phosphoribosylpyrophosphate amidotransferase
MCGIAGIYRRGEVPVPQGDRLARELLISIQSRGRDATGLLTMDDRGSASLRKNLMTASQFVATLGERRFVKDETRSVLLHTRFATIGSKQDVRNAHPVVSGTVAAVHNGTIFNSDELFAELQMERIGTVDSEVVPALIDKFGWDEIAECLRLTTGGASLAIVSDEHPTDLVLAKTCDWPLAYAVTDEMVIWASTPHSIREAWQRTYDGWANLDIRELPEGTVLRFRDGEEESRVKFEPNRRLPYVQQARDAWTPKAKSAWTAIDDTYEMLDDEDDCLDPYCDCPKGICLGAEHYETAYDAEVSDASLAILKQFAKEEQR